MGHLCGFFDSKSTINADSFDVPLELLGEETHRQPANRDEWEIVVNRTISPIVNRATLYHSYSLAMHTNRSDVVGSRYVQRYLRQLSVRGADATEFDVKRGMVCELLWTVPEISMGIWIDFASAVGQPDCKDWSKLPTCIQRRVAYTMDSKDPQRNRFPFNLCMFEDEFAVQIRNHICNIRPEALDISSCLRPVNSPQWCEACETTCKNTARFYISCMTFSIVLIPVFIFLTSEIIRFISRHNARSLVR